MNHTRSFLNETYPEASKHVRTESPEAFLSLFGFKEVYNSITNDKATLTCVFQGKVREYRLAIEVGEEMEQELVRMFDFLMAEMDSQEGHQKIMERYSEDGENRYLLMLVKRELRMLAYKEMCDAAERNLRITNVELVKKTGKSIKLTFDCVGYSQNRVYCIGETAMIRLMEDEQEVLKWYARLEPKIVEIEKKVRADFDLKKISLHQRSAFKHFLTTAVVRKIVDTPEYQIESLFDKTKWIDPKYAERTDIELFKESLY